MKIIVILAILGLIILVFRNKISAYLKEEFNVTKAINEDEVYLQPMIDKLAKEKTEFLLNRSAGELSDLERKAIQIVLRKRESQIYNA